MSTTVEVQAARLHNGAGTRQTPQREAGERVFSQDSARRDQGVRGRSYVLYNERGTQESSHGTS